MKTLKKFWQMFSFAGITGRVYIMTTPVISVIMLTYNREKLVGRAIESMLSQTFSDFEFIIVNNGSTDRSGEIADEYARKDGRIRVIHRERGNIGSGRNTGLDASGGEYVTFVDDDDWCEPDMLEFLYCLILENNADLAICGNASQARDEKILMNAEESIIKLMWRKHYTAAFPTKLFRRELMKDIRFPDTGVYDDIALMYRLLAEANLVVYHGLPKYTFYRHDNNNSAWTTNHKLITPETLDEYLQVYRQRTIWLSSRFPNNTEFWHYFEWSFMISMLEKIKRLNLKDCEAQALHIKKELTKNYDAFVNCGYLLDFEHEWMEEYL